MTRWLALLLLITGAAKGEPIRLAQASVPSLEDAVFISSSVDRTEVYLGEALNLSLEYWELKFRGVKVQARTRGTSPEMPNTEGFYGGPVVTEYEDSTRGGALYGVTHHTQRLYPAVAGDLTIGAWRWAGTVRGHTATGAKTAEIDVTTSPLHVRVRSLPTPPSTFRGAVGEFAISRALSSVDLSQGVPIAFTIVVTGSGNPGALEAPLIPEESWYAIGAPTEGTEPTVDPATGEFSKQFDYELMPLASGSFVFPAVSLTYFSPTEKRYKTLRTEAEPVQVAASGPTEAMVVVGGSGEGLGATSNGKLALAEEIATFSIHRERPWIAPLFIALPPLMYLLLLGITGNWRRVRWWRFWPAPARARNVMAAIVGHPDAPGALVDEVRGALSDRFGDLAPGLSVPELEAWIGARLPDEQAESIAAVLRACQAHRYGGHTLAPAEILALAERLQAALEPRDIPSARWSVTR